MGSGDLSCAGLTPSSNRTVAPDSGGGATLLRALGLSRRLHAGDLRRSRHEPGQSLSLFPLKEALIAGIAERDRAEVAQQFARADLSRGLFAVLEGLAHHHFAERPSEQVLLCTEVMAEARRHPQIARISAGFDADVRKWLGDLLRAAAARGDIPGDIDLEAVVTMLMIIADGVWWRRALDPDFDPKTVLPIFMDITRHMLRGQSRGPGGSVSVIKENSK